MNQTDYLKARFEQLQQEKPAGNLASVRSKAFSAFERMGIPTVRNEEWKYTRISGLFNKEYTLTADAAALNSSDLAAYHLPAHEDANVLVFINGIFAEQHSVIRSAGITIQSLEQAAENEYAAIVAAHFDHSSSYVNDGINALNTALLHGGIFVHIAKNKVIEHPVYIYHVSDARSTPVLAQPRSLVYLSENTQVQLAETYITIGGSGSFTNQVMEVVVEKDAQLSYYKIQNDSSDASQVNTTHIRQTGTSVVNVVTISLNGGIVRNNLHAVMEASHAEAHLYGLYFQQGSSHIDNHTVVDNVVPHCQSNELYKGILDNNATGVFNGKIFVRKDAQKTNAFQSNKNVLLSDAASVNTKPQLEIYADDVKCSHGCTVGSLDEEGLFYLQSRGIPYKAAIALLLQGFAMDILEKIRLEPIRTYVTELIAQRLTASI